MSRIAELRSAKLPAAEPRHREIQQHEARRGGGAMPDRAQQVKPLEAVSCRERVVSVRRENLPDHLAGVGIVLDDEYVPGG